jgi:copper-containing nitrite reductase
VLAARLGNGAEHAPGPTRPIPPLACGGDEPRLLEHAEVAADGVCVQARALRELVRGERARGGAKKLEQALPARIAERPMNDRIHGHARSFAGRDGSRIREFPDRGYAQVPMPTGLSSSSMRRRNGEWEEAMKVFTIGLGILVAGILAFAASMIAADRALTDDNDETTAVATTHAAGTATGHGMAESYAGAMPANAEQLAKAHKPYDAKLPPLQSGNLVKVHMTMKDRVVEIAPGVKYNVWAFDGDYSAPGPIVHVRQGQTVEMTLTNGGAISHSIDFHAARIAPNVAFRDVAPGQSFTFRFKANDPGVFMYHCGTKPVLAHIANGMYGAIVVRPRSMPAADNEYVLVASEWYLNGPGLTRPASLDMAKAHAMMPDWTTFNGYANQYVTHPLTAKPGDVTRFWVVAAGPTLDTDFHVVGTILDRAWVNQDMTHFQKGVQTVGVPAGGGAVFDVKIDDPGLYPFVSHAFAHVDLGQVGVLKVGSPKGTMTH